jgi:hypothetical protein
MKVTFRIGSLTACFFAIVPFTTGGERTFFGHGRSSPRKCAELPCEMVQPGQSSWRELVVLRASARGQRSRPRRKGGSLARTRFDSLAAIRDTTASDALFVLKDGTSHRMSLVSDFRVLYPVSIGAGRTQSFGNRSKNLFGLTLVADIPGRLSCNTASS